MACLLSERLTVATAAPFQCVAITSQLQALVERSGLDEGVLVAAGQHTTTALVVKSMVGCDGGEHGRRMGRYEYAMITFTAGAHMYLY